MAQWIISIIEAGGYAGIAFLMFVETLFPPIPSELVLPFAGFSAARGSLEVWGIILSGVIGSLAGSLLLYGIARLISDERLRRWIDKYGRVLTIDNEDIDNARAWFANYSNTAVFLGRLIPAVRSLISLPAGLNRMKLRSFIIFSAIGTAIWSSALTASGYLLGQEYERIQLYIEPVTRLIIAIVVGTYLYRLLFPKRRPSKRSSV